MSDKQSVVAVFETHSQAEEAIRELQRAGFPMKQLSIVGTDYRSEENVVGYYNTGDRVKFWGQQGAFWGGLWGFLVGSAFFWVPGLGPLLVGGPLVGWIVGALEGAVLGGSLTALGAALYSIGIPKDRVLQYQFDIKAGRYLLIAHGQADEVARARQILQETEGRVADYAPAATAA